MSILTELLEGKITFSQAASKAVGWANRVINADPALTQAAGDLVSAVKQGASDAISVADTALAPHLLDLAKAGEAALETALAGATNGMSVPFNPIIDSGIERIATVLKQAADAWALEAKARLAGPAVATPAATPAPAPAPVTPPVPPTPPSQQ